MLKATSCCHARVLILNSDKGQRSFGEKAKEVSAVPPRKQCFPKARGWRGTVGDLQINTLSGSQLLLIPSSVSASHVSGPVPAYNLAENLSLEWDYSTVRSKVSSFMGRHRKAGGAASLGGAKPALFVPLKDPHLLKATTQAVFPNNPPRGTAGADNTSNFHTSLVKFGIFHEA